MSRVGFSMMVLMAQLTGSAARAADYVSPLPLIAAEGPSVSEQSANKGVTVTFSLPSVVTLRADDRVKWDAYARPNAAEVGGWRLTTISDLEDYLTIEPIGRAASIKFNPGISGTYTVIAVAEINKVEYRGEITANILQDFSGRHFETPTSVVSAKWADPGNDQQVTIRVKYEQGNACCRMVGYFVDSSGGRVGEEYNGYSDSWTFTISSALYAQVGALKLRTIARIRETSRPDSTIYWSQLVGEFTNEIPIVINFKPGNFQKPTFQWRWLNYSSSATNKACDYVQNRSRCDLEIYPAFDWSKVPLNIGSVLASWRLQYLESGKWLDEKGIHPKISYSLSRGSLAELPSAVLQVDPTDSSGRWLAGSRTYRIYESYLSETLATFTVTFKADSGLASISVTYPKLVQYGKSYVASVRTTPRFSGTCRYYTYYLEDIPQGSSKLSNGISSLRFRALWPTNSGSMSTLKVVCTGGKYKGTGWATFIGTR